MTVISKAVDDADPLDTRTRTYIFYFAADRDIDGRRGKITGEESIVHNGTKWVRTTNIYTFNPNIRIEAPEEKVASKLGPIPVEVFIEARKNHRRMSSSSSFRSPGRHIPTRPARTACKEL